MPVILKRWMLSEVLLSFVGIEYCTFEMNIIIFTVLENMYPLYNFDFSVMQNFNHH